MSTYPNFPSHPHWSAHDLAAAVPLRLFELYRFEADEADDVGNAARFVRVKPARDFRGGYLRPEPLPTRFSVHH